MCSIHCIGKLMQFLIELLQNKCLDVRDLEHILVADAS